MTRLQGYIRNFQLSLNVLRVSIQHIVLRWKWNYAFTANYYKHIPLYSPMSKIKSGNTYSLFLEKTSGNKFSTYKAAHSFIASLIDVCTVWCVLMGGISCISKSHATSQSNWRFCLHLVHPLYVPDKGPCHSSGCWLLASHCGGPHLCPSQFSGIYSGQVAMRQIFLQIIWVFPVSVIPLLLHIHSCIIWGRTIGPFVVAVPPRDSVTPTQQ